MTRFVRRPSIILPAIALALVMIAVTALAENIDPANGGAPYAWSESAGWINFEPASGGSGVDVGATAVTGYAWGEAIGWINLNCSNPPNTCGTVNFGVTRSSENLGGYAWSESKGWIRFSCATAPSSCGTFAYGATVDNDTGEFAGFAWGESMGWISFDCDNTSSCASVPFGVQTTQDNDAAGGAPFGGTQAWIVDGVGPEGVNTGRNETDINDDNDRMCTDSEEMGGNINLGGMRNPLNPWDFADVPVPALRAVDTSGTRNGVVLLADALATFFYSGTFNNGPPNTNGVDYDSDLNGNGVEDGVEYDRTSAGPISRPRTERSLAPMHWWS